MKKFAGIFIVVLIIFLSGCQQKGPEADAINSAAADSSSQIAVVSQTQNTSDSKTKAAVKDSGSNTQAASQETNKQENKVQESKPQTAAVQNTSKPQPEPKKEAEVFTLVVSKNKSAEILIKKKIAIDGKKSALDYLRDNASVIDEGGFVKEINDLKTIPSMELTSEQKKAGILGVDWFLYQNGKKTGYGAADIYPENGDMINFDYKEWTYKDLAP